MTETTFNYRYITNDADFIVINKSALMRAYHIKAFQELSRSEHEQCYTVDFILNAIILPFIGIIGIVGNISGMLCFSKQLNLTYYALMFSLAISDLLTIVSFVCYYSLPLWLNHYTVIENQTIQNISQATTNCYRQRRCKWEILWRFKHWKWPKRKVFLCRNLPTRPFTYVFFIMLLNILRQSNHEDTYTWIVNVPGYLLFR